MGSSAGEEPSFFPAMSYPEKISAPLLAPDANSIEMAVSPAGAAAVDPDKTNAKRTLFKNMSPRRGAKESDNDKNCTPTTGEKRATRESHIVALCGYDPNATPEQICRTLIGKIDAQPLLSTRLRTSTEDSTTAESMKSTAEALDNLKAHISIFMKTVLDKMLQQDVEELKILMPFGTYLLAQLNSLAACACATGRRETEEQVQQQEEQEQQQQQGEQEQEQVQGQEQQEEKEQQQQAATAEVAAAMVARAVEAEAAAAAAAVMTAAVGADVAAATAGVKTAVVAATVTVKHASARADRRQAALQRQERERFEQQRFEQLCDREPKVRREPLLLVPRFDISLERSDLWFLTETDSISHSRDRMRDPRLVRLAV